MPDQELYLQLPSSRQYFRISLLFQCLFQYFSASGISVQWYFSISVPPTDQRYRFRAHPSIGR